MNEDQIRDSLDKFEAAVKGYTFAVEKHITLIESEVKNDLVKLSATIEVSVQSHTPVLTQCSGLIYFNACYAYLSAIMPRSPQLIEIAWAIYTAVVTIISIIQTIADIVQALHLKVIYDILMLVWPEFRKKMNEIYGKVADLSYQLGWGVDGIGHLLQATQSSINVVGGLLKKTPYWMSVDFADQYANVTKTFAANLATYSEDPGQLMDIVFSTGSANSRQEVDNWWRKTEGWITGISEQSEKTFEGLGTAVHELQALRAGMPEYVLRNIPQSIWDGLERADILIYDKLLPSINIVNERIAEINAVLANYSTRISAVAKKLARPGDVLLGVDDLPDFIKNQQEARVDDVTSRKFQEAADAEREAMSADLEAFDLIDETLAGAPPAPVFMTLEDPKRRAVLGIVYEPGETWFIKGDF